MWWSNIKFLWNNTMNNTYLQTLYIYLKVSVVAEALPFALSSLNPIPSSRPSPHIILTASLTLAQCSPAKSCSVALTVALTGNYTATVEEDWTSLAVTSSRSVQYGTQTLILSFHSQPHSLGLEISGVLDRDCLQKKPAVCRARFPCWNKACLVQGLKSMSKKKLPGFIGWLDTAVLTIHEYSPAFEDSNVHWFQCEAGWILGDRNEGFRDFWVSCNAFHPVFLPIPYIADTTSCPVSTWKRGSAWHFWGPSIPEMSWIGISLYAFPDPKPIHSSESPNSWNRVMASTTTSLSTVHRLALVWPCSAAWRKCNIIRVSASSSWHGDKASRSAVAQDQVSLRCQEEVLWACCGLLKFVTDVLKQHIFILTVWGNFAIELPLAEVF